MSPESRRNGTVNRRQDEYIRLTTTVYLSDCSPSQTRYALCLQSTTVTLNRFLYLLPARRRPSGIVVSGVCLSVCLSVCVCVCVCALFLSARYLKNGFMDHHQIRWVGAGGEPLEEV